MITVIAKNSRQIDKAARLVHISGSNRIILEFKIEDNKSYYEITADLDGKEAEKFRNDYYIMIT